MPFRPASATPDGPADPAGLRRGLTAVLRHRVRLLPALAPPRAALAARLAPVLLHASFDHAALRADAPGVAGLRYRRRWASLARAFGLPPPARAQRGAPLVEAVLALPAGERVEVLLVTAPHLPAADRQWVEQRAEAAEAILRAGGARVVLSPVDPAELGRSGHRAVTYGALVGGQLSPAAWAALSGLARRRLDPPAVAALAAAAPTPIAALAVTLLAGLAVPAPLQVITRLLGSGAAAQRLADPSELCVRWASGILPAADAGRLARALALSGLGGAAADEDAEDVLALGNALSLAAARAVRRARRGLAPDDRALWRERIGADLPRALRPALRERLRRGGPLPTELVRVGQAVQVRLPRGTVIGHGATPVQARVRALSALATGALEALVQHAESPWRSVMSRLAQARERPSVVFVVEPAAPSGPPFDPLNRGPERIVGFAGALAVRTAPGKRPTARVLTADQAVDRLLREVLRGTAVEALPGPVEANPVAARFNQLAAFLAEGGRALPRAAEAGGRVLLLSRGRVRHFPLYTFAARPRVFVPDPDAPDLTLSPGERRPAGLRRRGVIECRAQLVEGGRVEVLYADGEHGHLRELVPIPDLELHLREARELVQAADPQAVLAVRLADEIEPAVRRGGRPSTPIEVALRARLPHAIEVNVGGEWYGGASGRTFSDAARAVLLRWPGGSAVRLAVTSLHATLHGVRQGGLLALWVRSAGLRRLRTHMLGALGPYRSSQAGRSTG